MANGNKAQQPVMVGDRTIPPPGARFITVYIMGEAYKVPETLTILKAMEFAGYRFRRGCGCRGGICGACGTFYRLENDHNIHTGLACQTIVQDGMILAQMPFFPPHRGTCLDQNRDLPPDQRIALLYPEIFRCVGCGTCSRTCPMGIDVMDYIASFKRGDVRGGAEKSFNCIMCGMCVSRCPANITQMLVAMAARRMTALHLTPRSEATRLRAEKIRAGYYEPMLEELTKKSVAELKELYIHREREPDMAKAGQWMPQDQSHL
ncbi:MAG: 4Fe-4S dicluster domain-containing protein [Magnetococcus sp. XQGC-1]